MSSATGGRLAPPLGGLGRSARGVLLLRGAARARAGASWVLRTRLSHLMDLRYFSRQAWWYRQLSGGQALKEQSMATTSVTSLSASWPHRSQLPLSWCSTLVPPNPAAEGKRAPGWGTPYATAPFL